MRPLKKYFSYLFLFLMPLSVSVPQKDSTGTSIKFFGGRGQYALIVYGCSDDEILHKKAVPFTEVGASVEHTLDKHFSVGVKAESISDLQEHVTTNENYDEEYSYTKRNGVLLSPFVRLHFKYLELGFSGNFPTVSLYLGPYGEAQAPYKWMGGGYLRFGFPFLFFRLSIFYDYPLYLNGLSNIGLGSQITKNLGIWLGSEISFFYRSQGILFKGSYRLNKAVELSLILRSGSYQGISESGVGAGVRFYLK